MPDHGNIINTVTFFQGAFTIILSLSLGEALKSFTSDNQELPVHWNRVPALLAFLLVFFPFLPEHESILLLYVSRPADCVEILSRLSRIRRDDIHVPGRLLFHDVALAGAPSLAALLHDRAHSHADQHLLERLSAIPVVSMCSAGWP